MTEARTCRDLGQVIDAVIDQAGPDIVLALPLGLGKANHVVNGLFERVAADRSLSLKILTALTLERPVPRSELERRFLEPIAGRFFDGYPELKYAAALRSGELPTNIEVHEFFLMPGRWLGNPVAQQNYHAINYTHVLDFLLDNGINVVAQLVAPRPDGSADTFSLSSNPDISADLFDARLRGRIDFMAVGQVNRELPYLEGGAERAASEFDLLLDSEDFDFPLFKTPHEPLSSADHAIGLRAASLVPDGGTLQVGIGSIGDAVIHGLLLRQRDNDIFKRLLKALGTDATVPSWRTEPFRAGLYGVSEMFTEGFLDLIEAGVLKREVDGILLHAGFFVGSPLFYEKLAGLDAAVRRKIAMMPIRFINELYHGEEEKRAARPGARFINSAMMATLLGAVVSDGLADGRVVSGVGGQYNFVAMAFALDDARSVITLPATRSRSGQTASNIRLNYGHTTIPRHLRDLVVTEYGIADLRGKSDAEVIAAMLAVADSRFQGELLEQAKSAGKIGADYKIPADQRQNLPERLAADLEPLRDAANLTAFPLGSSFTETEEELVPALHMLSEAAGSKGELARLAWHGWRAESRAAVQRNCLERMGLSRPESLRDRFYRALLLAALEEAD